MATVISDAGPLIALAKVDSLFIPRELFSRLRIPEAVWLECRKKAGVDSRRIELAANEGWLEVVSVPNSRPFPVSLGSGEAEAIQLALETDKALLIMDDRLARREDADMDTCIWVVPGSHKWSDARTAEAIAERNRDGFSTRGAEPMPLHAGDVLFHNVRLLHGSPPNVSDKLRRVVYYTFHTVRVEWEHGPFTREYVIAKQKVLRACLRERRTTPYGADEAPFDYRPPPALDKGPLADGETPATFRYPANEYQIA